MQKDRVVRGGIGRKDQHRPKTAADEGEGKPLDDDGAAGGQSVSVRESMYLPCEKGAGRLAAGMNQTAQPQKGKTVRKQAPQNAGDIEEKESVGEAGGNAVDNRNTEGRSYRQEGG